MLCWADLCKLKLIDGLGCLKLVSITFWQNSTPKSDMNHFCIGTAALQAGCTAALQARGYCRVACRLYCNAADYRYCSIEGKPSRETYFLN